MYNHNKAQQSKKTVCIFPGIYCTPPKPIYTENMILAHVEHTQFGENALHIVDFFRLSPGIGCGEVKVIISCSVHLQRTVTSL